MVVTPTSYPGGPQGVSARLERRDLWPLVRRLLRWTWLPAAGCVLLAAVFYSLYSGPSIYGLLTVMCSGLALFFFISPFAMALTLRMDIFYFDEQWAASYNPHRRSSADLTRVNSVRASSGVWSFQRRGRAGIVVPEVLVLLEPVRALVSRAVSEAARTHNVKMSDRTRDLLGAATSDESQNSGMFAVIAKPPLRSWDGVRRPPRRRRASP